MDFSHYPDLLYTHGFAWDRMVFMQRQCAWCLRMMDHLGEPISSPQPKHYEVSHGMCRVCGLLWLEDAICDTEKQEVKQRDVKAVFNKMEEDTA